MRKAQACHVQRESGQRPLTVIQFDGHHAGIHSETLAMDRDNDC